MVEHEKPALLIVDDDPMLRRTTVDILKGKGYHVFAVGNGGDALALLKEHEDICAALIDLRLDDISGIDLLREIKSISPDTECIVVTGYASQATAIEAIDLGAFSYVQKPYDLENLLVIIRRAVEKHLAFRALQESEARFRYIFNSVGVSLWEEDYSESVRILNQLRESGVSDLRAYLEQNPDQLHQLVSSVRVVDVNPATLTLFGAKEKSELLQNLDAIIPKEAVDHAIDEFVAIFEGKHHYVGETVNRTLDGREIQVLLNITFPEQGEEFDRVLVSLMDISDRKKMEEDLRRRTTELELLYRAGKELGETLDLEQIFMRLQGILKKAIPCTAIVVSEYNPEQELITCVFATADGQKVDVRDFPPLKLLPEGEGVQSKVIRSGTSLLANDYWREYNSENERYIFDSDGTLIPYQDEPEKDMTRSAIAVPLLEGGKVSGVLQVMSNQPDAYTETDVRFVEALAAQLSNALNNARLYQMAQEEIERRRRVEANLARQMERLSALHSIDMTITASMDIGLTFNIVLDNAISHLGVDAGAVLLRQEGSLTLRYTTTRGFMVPFPREILLRFGEGLAGLAALEQRFVSHEDLPKEEENNRIMRFYRSQGYQGCYAIPLMSKGEVRGVMELVARKPVTTDLDWRDFFETLAGQAAIALDNATLFDTVQRTNLELMLAYDTTLEGWAKALELRDQETEGHAQRVSNMTVELARLMGVGDTDIVHIRRGALLHDIGKMGIPDRILLKPEKLTPEEMEIIKQHPVYAYEMLSPIQFLRPALDIPYCHHERWDGNGYPRGLKAHQIPLAAQIFAVVDVYDAMTSDRPYRKALSEKEALEYIRSQAGSHFDPQVVDAFFNLLERNKR